MEDKGAESQYSRLMGTYWEQVIDIDNNFRLLQREGRSMASLALGTLRGSPRAFLGGHLALRVVD